MEEIHMKFARKLQRHALPDYCNYSSAASAVAGKDIMLLVYDDNDELLAIAGQRSLTINRSADSIEVSSKDTEGGWKSNLAGMKEWSIETDGLYVASDTSMQKLSKAFQNSDPVCLVVKNVKTDSYMFGGQAAITDFPLEAPYDDALTYSVTFSGNGQLVDLTSLAVAPAQLTVTKPTSGTRTASATVTGKKGTLTVNSDYTGVTATLNGNKVNVSVSSSASPGLARITVTDTYTGGTATCELLVIVNAPSA
jgi:TP901-1 family phage major tail protein